MYKSAYEQASKDIDFVERKLSCCLTDEEKKKPMNTSIINTSAITFAMKYFEKNIKHKE